MHLLVQACLASAFHTMTATYANDNGRPSSELAE